MKDSLAVLFGYERDEAIAGFPQFFYEFSFSRSPEGRQNDLVNSFPVRLIFIADGNHHPI